MNWNRDPLYIKPQMEVLKDATVSPLTFLNVARDGHKGNFNGGVYYKGGELCDLGLQIKGAYNNIPDDEPLVADVLGGRHVFGGMLQNWHFGHFVTESLSRIWAVRELLDIRSVVFYLRHPETVRLPAWAIDSLEICTGGLPLTIIRRPTRVENLIVPSQVVHRNSGMIYGHPVSRGMFCEAYGESEDLPARIYVSRSKLHLGLGGIVCEHVLEENLSRAGYFIVYPEKMTVREQVRLYRAAKSLIFAEGSSAHLYAMVARPEQRVFCVWRRTSPAWVLEWQIKTFGGAAMLGRPAISRLYIPNRDGADQVHARAVLDFDALREQLRSAGFLSSSEWAIPNQELIEVELQSITDVRIVES